MTIDVRRAAGLALATLLTGGLAAGFLSASPAAAAQPSPRSNDVATVAGLHAAPSPLAVRVCYAEVRRGVRSVTVRSGRTIRSAPIGRLAAGQLIPAACTTTAGQAYRYRGCQASSRWLRVVLSGRAGWVPRGCVSWVYTGR